MLSSPLLHMRLGFRLINLRQPSLMISDALHRCGRQRRKALGHLSQVSYSMLHPSVDICDVVVPAWLRSCTEVQDVGELAQDVGELAQHEVTLHGAFAPQLASNNVRFSRSTDEVALARASSNQVRKSRSVQGKCERKWSPILFLAFPTLRPTLLPSISPDTIQGRPFEEAPNIEINTMTSSHGKSSMWDKTKSASNTWYCTLGASTSLSELLADLVVCCTTGFKKSARLSTSCRKS